MAKWVRKLVVSGNWRGGGETGREREFKGVGGRGELVVVGEDGEEGRKC